MILSDENIREFQAIYKEHFGTEISKEDAYENGTKLLRLVSLIYRPTSSNEQLEIQKKQNTLSTKITKN